MITLQVLLVVKGPRVVQLYGTMICLERLLSFLNVVGFRASAVQVQVQTDQGDQHACFEKGRPKINHLWSSNQGGVGWRPTIL